MLTTPPNEAIELPKVSKDTYVLLDADRVYTKAWPEEPAFLEPITRAPAETYTEVPKYKQPLGALRVCTSTIVEEEKTRL